MSTSDLYFQPDRDCEWERGGPDIQRQQQRGGAHRGEEAEKYRGCQEQVNMMTACHHYFVQVTQLSMCCLGPGYCAV